MSHHRSYSLQGLETTTITEIIRISLVRIHQDTKLGGVMMATPPRIVELKIYAPAQLVRVPATILKLLFRLSLEIKILSPYPENEGSKAVSQIPRWQARCHAWT